MLIDSRDVRLLLHRGDHLRLTCASGARLTSVDGIAWITVDHDLNDVVVPAGDSFLVQSDRPVLVGALYGAATVDLQGTPRTVASAVTRRFDAPAAAKPGSTDIPGGAYVGT